MRLGANTRPTGGEIDIFEFNLDWAQDRAWGSYHWGLPGECGKDRAPIPGKGIKPAGAGDNWQEDWHVYAVEWYEDRIDYFVDNKKFLTIDDSGGRLLPTSPMFIIFDQAVDSWLFPPASGAGDFNGTAGVRMRVAWVRAYRASA